MRIVLFPGNIERASWCLSRFSSSSMKFFGYFYSVEVQSSWRFKKARC